MNGSTVSNLLRSGYSLSSKDVFVPWSTNRQILYSRVVKRDYHGSWSMQPNHKNTLLAQSIWVRHVNINSILITDLRCLSTTSPQNDPTVLKAKSTTRGDGRKPPKDKEESSAGDKFATAKAKANVANGKVADKTEELTQPEEKLTLTAKFKKMYKEYWYVLLPVHIATSTLWLGGFYYLSTSGVDIPSVLETMHFSESTIASLRDSSMGHLAML